MDIDFEKDNRTITLSDAREFQKGCVKGWKRFIEINGFNWKTTIKHGLSAKELWNTKDAMAQALVEKVYGRK